jgi:uncharacterized protein (DUF1330 family)
VPGYVLVGVAWHDEDAYEAYVRDVEETIEAFAGRYLVGTRDVDVREGGWRPEIAVILEFPTLDAARSWYESGAYAGLLGIRQRGATSDLVIVGGIGE